MPLIDRYRKLAEEITSSSPSALESAERLLKITGNSDAAAILEKVIRFLKEYDFEKAYPLIEKLLQDKAVF
jgi:hypothetical protein